MDKIKNMYTFWIFFLVLILFFPYSAWCAQRDPVVTVCILAKKHNIAISSTAGLRVLINKKTYPVEAQKSLTFSSSGTKVMWEEKQFFSSSVRITTQGKGFLLVDNRPYRGSLTLKSDRGSLTLINHVYLDDYVRGIINMEINPHWPEEAVKAQIIAARTYALKNRDRHKDQGYDFCASSHCQVYGGVNAEDPLTNALVDSTQGLILTYQNQPAEVCFHSESGGITDSAFNVWGKNVPYLISVDSKWEKDSPHAYWEVKLSIDELNVSLQKAGLIQGNIVQIQVQPNEPSRRVKDFIIKTTRQTYQIPASRVRQVLGFDRLPSTFFEFIPIFNTPRLITPTPTITPNPAPLNPIQSNSEKNNQNLQEMLDKDWDLDDIIDFLKLRELEREQISKANNPSTTQSPNFNEAAVKMNVSNDKDSLPASYSLSSVLLKGRGYGHGVGLSQWGARGMALEGYNYQEILLHYFPGCEIKKARFK